MDLAGSERVAKTKIDGLQLTEAKHINLSLHHLEGKSHAQKYAGMHIKATGIETMKISHQRYTNILILDVIWDVFQTEFTSYAKTSSVLSEPLQTERVPKARFHPTPCTTQCARV